MKRPDDFLDHVLFLLFRNQQQDFAKQSSTMTLPAGNIWCPECRESHHDQQICSVCGTALVEPPPDPPQPRESNNNRILPTFRDVYPDHAELSTSIARLQQVSSDLHRSGGNLQDVMQMLQLQIQQIEHAQTLMQNNLDSLGDHILQFAPAANLRSNPTDTSFLESLPRITLTPQSHLLRQARIRLKDGTDLECASAGFGGMETVTGSPSISHRGDGTTFVKRAQMAQEEGYPACVVINNVDQPWPFHMTDSQRLGASITIPVVLLRKSCGPALLASPHDVTVTVESRSEDCCVCTECFAPGNTLIELPRCHHRFHEACALTWLRQHNTCPYCRDQVDSSEPQERSANEHGTFYG